MVLPPAWTSAIPLVNDICLAYFPYVEDDGRPSTDIHPVLVLARGKKPDGQVCLFVAYGSSRGLGHAAENNLVIDDVSTPPGSLTGLLYPTRFDLSRTRFLPYDTAYFHVAVAKRTPVIGSLPAELIPALEAARRAEEIRTGVGLIPNQPRLGPAAEAK